MPLGQGWLNAWVKVNSKHVVFPPNSKNDRESEKDDVLNKAIGKNQKGSKTNSSVTTARTAATGTSEDAETQAMRRFHHRKHRRRLQRTVSASDLLRDKAKGKVEKGDKKAKDEEAVLDKSSSSHVSSSHKVVPVSSQSDTHEKALPNLPQHEDRSIVSGETEKSLSFVAGFFGADIESLDAGAAHHPKFTHSASFHDAASVQVIGHHSRLDAGSVISRGGQSLPARPIYSLPRSDSSESSSSKGGGLGIRFPPNLFAGDNNSKAGCRQCSKLEGELLASQEDLEYLRSMALRSEYMCATCQTEPSKKIHTHVSPEAGDGAQILNEATERHKAQIETLIQERARWQQETHVKIQKYASLCKDLNEEASLRNEEALVLHKDLDAVRTERDDMATELEKARALIARYEKSEQERKKSELILQQYELKGLDGADRAVQMRDAIIVDLTGRLERALDMLELERAQQRQRRQIIFPNQRPSQSLDGRLTEESESELKSTKYALLECQSTVESLKRDADKKEMEWKFRIENLERQLEAARSKVTLS